MRFERTNRPYKCDDRDEGEFPKNLVDLPVTEKLNLALLCVADKTPAFGKPSTCDSRTDWPMAQARDQAEFVEMLKAWLEEGVFSGQFGGLLLNEARGGLALTAQGWRRVEEIRPSRGRRGNQAFVAMSFDPTMNLAYEKGIEPALREAGWDSFRVDRTPSEDKICDKIISEIRRSDLVVAECTGSRPNVYFEAGFAMGLGIPVIWCIKKSEIDGHKMAFDTRQYPHLVWNGEAELRSLLVDRIGALYAREPRSAGR